MKTIKVEMYCKLNVIVPDNADTSEIISEAKDELRRRFKTKKGEKFDVGNIFSVLIIGEEK